MAWTATAARCHLKVAGVARAAKLREKGTVAALTPDDLASRLRGRPRVGCAALGLALAALGGAPATAAEPSRGPPGASDGASGGADAGPKPATPDRGPGEDGPSAHAGPLLLLVPAEVGPDRRAAITRAVRAHTVDLGAPFEVVEVDAWPGDLLGRVRVAMDRAHQVGARGVFWVEGEAGDDLLVYLIEPDGLKALVRRIPRDGASDAALLESVGVIVRASGEALLAGRSIGMEEVAVEPEPAREPEPAPKPRPPPKPEPSPTSPGGTKARARGWRLLAPEVGYVGANVGDTLPWQSGVTVGLALRPLERLTLRLAYDGLMPARARTEVVALTVQRHGARLTVAFRGTPRPWLALEAGAWILTDVVVRRSRDGTLAGSGASTRVVPALGPQLRLAMRPLADLWIFLGAGVDVPLLDVDYVVDVQDGMNTTRQVVLNTHPLRARISAGLLYSLF